MKELKPCPFCGSKAAIGKRSLSSNGDNYYYVVCTKCSSSTNCIKPEQAPYTEEMAIMLWNMRK